jgi:hypothetical protein
VDPALDPDPVTPARAIRRKKEEKERGEMSKKRVRKLERSKMNITFWRESSKKS